MLEYEICQNSDLNYIIYFHKLLTVNKTEFLTVSNNLSLKKQHHKSKQATWYSFHIHLWNEAHDLSYSFSIHVLNKACNFSYSFSIHVLNEACDFSAVKIQQSTLIHSILSCTSCILLSLRTATFFKKRHLLWIQCCHSF